MSDYIKLQRALLTNDLTVVATVLKEIQDVNTIWGSGICFLHYYISEAKNLSYKPEDIIDVFCNNGGNIDLQNSKGISPLHYVTYHPDSNIAKKFIDRGAKVDIQDENGNTPLWRAVMNFRGEDELLNVILELLDDGANPDKENNSGNSPRKIVLRRHDNIPKTKQPEEWDLQPHLNW